MNNEWTESKSAAATPSAVRPSAALGDGSATPARAAAGAAAGASHAAAAKELPWPVLENLQIPLLVTAPNGTVVLVNAEAEQLFGYSRAELIGQPVDLLVPNRLRGKHVAGREAYMVHPEPRKLLGRELQGRRKDGSEVWLEIGLNPVATPDGLFILATIFDLTERRAAEQALRESEENFRELFDNCNDMVQAVRPDGSFAYVNRAWHATLGYTAVEAARLNVFDVIHPDFRAHCREALAKVLSGEDIGRVEVQFVCKDGRPIWVEGSTNCRFVAGRPVTTRGIFRDVTQRKQAEEQAGRYRALLEAIHHAQTQFLGDPRPSVVFDRLLADLLALTGSEYGFIGEVLETAQGQPYLKSHAISNIAWNQETRELYEKNMLQGWEWYNLKTLFGAVMTTGQPVLANDPSHDPRRGGLPAGHPALRSFLGLPFHYGDRLVGMVGIANRPGGYDQAVIDYLQPFLTTCGHLIEAYRNNKRRLAAEEALRRSQALYHTLVENLPMNLFTKDLEGRFTFANQHFCALLGKTLDEVVGKTDHDFFPPELADAYRRDDRRVVETNARLDQEEEHQLAGGRKVHVQAIKVPIRDDQGQITGVQGIFWDITQRKRNETLLRTLAEGIGGATSDTFFQTLVEYLAKALGVEFAFVGELADARGESAETVAVWMDGHLAPSLRYELAGTPCENVLRRDLCCYPEKVQQLFPRDRMLAEMGAESYCGTPLRDTSGACLGLISVLGRRPLRDGAGVEMVLRIFAARAAAELERRRAEAERRRLEAQIQHAQKLESLGVLAGGIAHDFNNLLTSILGYASLARMGLPATSPAKEALHQIETAAHRAADLTSQMLAYAGKGRFVVATVDLCEIVAEMTDLLQTVISKKAVLRFDMASRPVLVKADAAQLRQVIMNLITNASDALGDKSGVIVVRTSVICAERDYLASTYVAEELPPGLYSYLEVSDTGCGMDQATLEKIFDPFFTTKFTGRGLGLAAVLGIVRGHKGTIKIDSESGKGSTFKVLLPCAASADIEPAATPVAAAWRGSGTILVIDDEEGVRGLAREALEQAGCRVLLAADARAGIDLYRQHHQDIAAVLLDLTMPHLGGEEVFRELQRIRPDVRTVLMSGYGEDEVMGLFAGKGLAGFLQKPFGVQDLLATLARVHPHTGSTARESS